jgi:hypothetical protein
MATESVTDAAIFNAGCDARLAGRPSSANPHAGGIARDYFVWKLGWTDIDRFWGKWARWPVMRLPDVKEREPAA